MRSEWLRLCVLAAVATATVASLPSCGGDDKKGGSAGAGTSAGTAGRNAGGSGGFAGNGRGGSGTAGSVAGGSSSVTCGDAVCQPVQTGGPAIPACCFDAASSQCGLDTTPLALLGVVPSRPCEPLGQPGEPDMTCPNSEPFTLGTTMLPAFQGCCREETGQCGYLINRVGGILPVGLGCVDSAPFLDGGAPSPCGSGAGGAP